MNQTQHTRAFPTGQRLEIAQGDITTEQVDAIVNAANEMLAHGGGVAAAIARKGGPIVGQQSREWVQKYGPVSHEAPAYTDGGDLPAKYIIHAVGPVWGSGDEPRKLAAAVRGSLAVAEQLGLGSIAFPAISTGIFGYPKAPAGRVMLETVRTYFENRPESGIGLVRITLFDQQTFDAFLQAQEET